MAKFVLVDHSLRNVGGHQYEYANQILREAELAGYEPVLATHRRFRPRASLPGTWQVYPLFQSDVYGKYAASWDPNRSRDELPWDSRDAENGESNATSCSPVAWVRRWRRLVAHLDRLRRGGRFELACRRLVQSVELQAGDIVFLATVSELDLQALTAFLQRDPRTQAADWHVQFHFDVLSGRDADYDFQQTQLQSMRSLFEDALHQIPDHRVFLHCTTAQLAAQYNRLIPGAPVGAFISLQSDSDIARFTLANAYAPRQTAISGFEFGFATADEAASRSLPAGAVGLVAADEQQIPRLLADMIQHYGHYRESAGLFSQEWMRRHSPQKTFATLIGRGNQVAGTLRLPAA